MQFIIWYKRTGIYTSFGVYYTRWDHSRKEAHDLRRRCLSELSGCESTIIRKFTGMDCQESCNCIPLFIEDKLTGDELSAFLLHVKSCKSCYEEMETNYLLKEALSRLEQGESFNIHAELLKKFRIYEKLSGLHNAAQLTRRVILLISAFAVGICMLSLYI